MKALREIGLRRALRFGIFTILYTGYRLLLFPQLRAPYLRLLGARIGRDCIIHDVRFFNHYRLGFRGFQVGDACFIGDECLFDLAAPIVIESQVTITERVTILTHINVGYADHPLQSAIPRGEGGVMIRSGCFVGANVTILHGVEIGRGSAVAACSLVKSNVPAGALVAGVPARLIRDLVGTQSTVERS